MWIPTTGATRIGHGRFQPGYLPAGAKRIG